MMHWLITLEPKEEWLGNLTHLRCIAGIGRWIVEDFDTPQFEVLMLALDETDTFAHSLHWRNCCWNMVNHL
jgi:hypothetical protein